MFYLLNSLYSKVWNKRIVCDKELLDRYKERGNDYFGEPEIEIYQNPTKKLELHIVGKKKYGGKYIYADEGIVELQSENVFDLIEEGDLVMVDRAKIYSNFYTEPIIEVSQIFWSDSHNSLCVYPRGNGYYCPIIESGVQKGILAIYKPNLEGDYIKVWEKKEK